MRVKQAAYNIVLNYIESLNDYDQIKVIHNDLSSRDVRNSNKNNPKTLLIFFDSIQKVQDIHTIDTDFITITRNYSVVLNEIVSAIMNHSSDNLPLTLEANMNLISGSYMIPLLKALLTIPSHDNELIDSYENWYITKHIKKSEKVNVYLRKNLESTTCSNFDSYVKFYDIFVDSPTELIKYDHFLSYKDDKLLIKYANRIEYSKLINLIRVLHESSTKHITVEFTDDIKIAHVLLHNDITYTEHFTYLNKLANRASILSPRFFIHVANILNINLVDIKSSGELIYAYFD